MGAPLITMVAENCLCVSKGFWAQAAMVKQTSANPVANIRTLAATVFSLVEPGGKRTGSSYTFRAGKLNGNWHTAQKNEKKSKTVGGIELRPEAPRHRGEAISSPSFCGLWENFGYDAEPCSPGAQATTSR
jgi:hypothetical protein